MKIVNNKQVTLNSRVDEYATNCSQWSTETVLSFKRDSDRVFVFGLPLGREIARPIFEYLI